MKIQLIILTSLSILSSMVMAVDPLKPSYPSILPEYENLSIGKLVAQAQVDFSPSQVVIGETNGYIVTDPFGNTFVVDNIDDPTYAFYGTYIETSDNLTVFDLPEINSTVYVEEITFGNF